jgi:hypothetical protein
MLCKAFEIRYLQIKLPELFARRRSPKPGKNTSINDLFASGAKYAKM